MRKEGNHRQPLLGFMGRITYPNGNLILTHVFSRVNSTNVPLHAPRSRLTFAAI